LSRAGRQRNFTLSDVTSKALKPLGAVGRRVSKAACAVQVGPNKVATIAVAIKIESKRDHFIVVSSQKKIYENDFVNTNYHILRMDTIEKHAQSVSNCERFVSFSKTCSFVGIGATFSDVRVLVNKDN
jgi:hypothetical protein